jgi:hypothetical protein
MVGRLPACDPPAFATILQQAMLDRRMAREQVRLACRQEGFATTQVYMHYLCEGKRVPTADRVTAIVRALGLGHNDKFMREMHIAAARDMGYKI